MPRLDASVSHRGIDKWKMDACAVVMACWKICIMPYGTCCRPCTSWWRCQCQKWRGWRGRWYQLLYLVIETSGISNPWSIIRTLGAKFGKCFRATRLGSIMTVIDADQMLPYCSSTSSDDNVSRMSQAAMLQLECADVVIVNYCSPSSLTLASRPRPSSSSTLAIVFFDSRILAAFIFVSRILPSCRCLSVLLTFHCLAVFYYYSHHLVLYYYSHVTVLLPLLLLASCHLLLLLFCYSPWLSRK